MFRGVVLVGFRRLFSTPSQGRVVPVDGRCARPPSAKRAFSLERPTCVRSRSTTRAPSDGSFCSLGRTARARRENAQGAMTKKSPSEKEKSETVRARVADEATMVAMPVIVRATRRRFTPGTVSRTTTMMPSLFRSSLRDVLAHAPSGVRTASHHPTSQMPTRADTEDGGEPPRSLCVRFSFPWTVLLRGSSWWTGCVVSRSCPTSSASPSFSEN